MPQNVSDSPPNPPGSPSSQSGPQSSSHEPPSSSLGAWAEGARCDKDSPVFSSTVIFSGSATQEERDRKVKEMASRGVVLQYCPRCGAALDVSECFPLAQIACPECSERMKVLERFGPFVLLSVLGKGGMGFVCRAFDRNLERDVALKLIRNEYMNDPDYITQLKTEATCMALVVHPNVVRVYSTGIENGIYFIAMEIVSGGTVAKIMEHQRLPEKTCLNIAIQVAEGLAAAVRAGLLHRDIKPGNILVGDAGQFKMADFGLALTVQQASNTDGDVWGTPEYVSPEKILKQGEDVRSDIYSLGATLFHMLTGRRLFDGKTPSEVALKHVENHPLGVQTFAPEVSDETSAVIARMLEKDPEKRQQSYDELLAEFRYVQTKIEEGQTERQQIRGSMAQQQQEEQKSSAMVVLMTLGAVALITGFALVIRNSRSSDPAEIDSGSPPLIESRAQSQTVRAPAVSPSLPPSTPKAFLLPDPLLANFPQGSALFSHTENFVTRTPSHATRIPSPDARFTSLFECRNQAAAERSWDVFIKWPITGAFKEGDVLLAVFCARLLESPPDAEGAKMAVVVESLDRPPRKSLTGRVNLTQKWQKYYLPFKALHDSTTGATFDIRFGDKIVTWQLADPVVIHYGASVRLEDLPNSRRAMEE